MSIRCSIKPSGIGSSDSADASKADPGRLLHRAFAIIQRQNAAAVERIDQDFLPRTTAWTMKCPGKPMPAMFNPARLPTAIVTADRLIGMPVRRSSTWLK